MTYNIPQSHFGMMYIHESWLILLWIATSRVLNHKHILNIMQIPMFNGFDELCIPYHPIISYDAPMDKNLTNAPWSLRGFFLTELCAPRCIDAFSPLALDTRNFRVPQGFGSMVFYRTSMDFRRFLKCYFRGLEGNVQLHNVEPRPWDFQILWVISIVWCGYPVITIINQFMSRGLHFVGDYGISKLFFRLHGAVLVENLFGWKQWELTRFQKWRHTSIIFQAIFSGDITLHTPKK